MHFILKRKKRQVDLTPMVSIVFLLIIFFLVAGTIRSPAFWNIELAQSTSEDRVNSKVLNVYLNQNGEFAYEKQSVNLEQLKNTLTSQNSDAIIQIHADFRADSLKLIQLLDALRYSVINKVALITQNKR